MKKDKMVKQPEITLVWEFRGSNIFIEGNRIKAKEFSEYMELWFQALQFIDTNYQTLSNNKKSDVSITKTTRPKKSSWSKSIN